MQKATVRLVKGKRESSTEWGTGDREYLCLASHVRFYLYHQFFYPSNLGVTFPNVRMSFESRCCKLLDALKVSGGFDVSESFNGNYPKVSIGIFLAMKHCPYTVGVKHASLMGTMLRCGSLMAYKSLNATLLNRTFDPVHFFPSTPQAYLTS